MLTGPGFFWLILIGTAFLLDVLWLVDATLPRTPSQSAGTYFQLSFLLKAQKHARLSYISSGLQTLALLIIALLIVRYWLIPADSNSSLRTGDSPNQRPLALTGALRAGTLTAAFFGVGLSLVNLPFQFYNGFYLEKTFGLSTESIWSWLLNYSKGSILNTVIYVVAGAFCAAMFVTARGTWVFWITIGFFVLSVFGAYIYPTLVAPLFDKFRPLEDAVAAKEITDLSRKAGVNVDRILVLEASRKTTKVNAYFAGVGPSKQVVLYDNLLTGHSLSEIRLVVAHELGHWQKSHILKGILISTMGVFVLLLAFYFLSNGFLGEVKLSDNFSQPALSRHLVAFFVFVFLVSYLFTPLSNAVSRHFEVETDLFSLNLTADPSTFIATQINLAEANLADVEPPAFVKWFAWTHPSAMDRIRLALRYLQQ